MQKVIFNGSRAIRILMQIIWRDKGLTENNGKFGMTVSLLLCLVHWFGAMPIAMMTSFWMHSLTVRTRDRMIKGGPQKQAWVGWSCSRIQIWPVAVRRPLLQMLEGTRRKVQWLNACSLEGVATSCA